MNFNIDYHVDVGDEQIPSTVVAANIEQHNEALNDVAAVTADLALTIGDDVKMGDFSDPIVRLAGIWVQKVVWVIAGDTETVALRNSEQCFAFVPTGKSVAMSFYDGDEGEIENYIIEPVTIPLDTYVEASFTFAEHVLALVKDVNTSALAEDEDCQDLVSNLKEAKEAWHDYQIHQR